MARCQKCKREMLNYSIKYADILYKIAFCWRPKCDIYFEITPKIHSPITDAIQDNPKIVLELLEQKMLKPII